MLSGERIPRRLIFENFISNLPPYSGFSFAIVLTVINKVNDFRISQD